MSNKLPERYENNFFSKIKRVFFYMFGNKKSIVEPKSVTQEKKIETKPKETEFDKMKEASNKVKLKEDILTIIDKNPNLINTLSLERLKELERMYDEIIEENDRKIKKLKREIAQGQ